MIADPVAEVLGLVHRVGGEHDGDAAVAQLADHRPGRRARVRVHARGRLVEEHQRRLADQRERERQALLLTARHAPHERAPRVVETDELQQPLGVVGIVVVGGEELERLERAARPGRARPPAASRRCAVAGAAPSRHGSTPEDAHLAGVGAAVALEDLDRRGLARAVRSEQAEDLTGGDREA